MQPLILALCALLVAGIVTTAFVALWSTRASAARTAAFRQRFAAEFVWTAIPCLMLFAATIAAAAAVVAAHSR